MTLHAGDIETCDHRRSTPTGRSSIPPGELDMATRQDGPAARPADPPSQGRIPIPASVLGRVAGRILDPGKAGTLGGAPVRPTAYVAGELIVQGPPSATDELVEAARATGHRMDSTSALPDAY